MEKTDHCLLCEHQILNPMTGTNCGLTNKKPDFDDICTKIKLKDKFFQRIEDINVEYNLVQKKKMTSIANFVFFLTIAVAIMTAGYVVGKYVLAAGYISTVPIIIYFFGLMVLPFAFGPLNNYRQSMNVAQSKKDTLDQVITAYGLDYDFDIKIAKGLHKIWDITTKIIIHKEGEELGSYNNTFTYNANEPDNSPKIGNVLYGLVNKDSGFYF